MPVGLLAAALLAGASSALLVLPAPLAESSGVAASSVSDDWFFTHEDSGAPAQFSAVALDGRLLATYALPGVQARDWEDMARGPDEQGRSSLWLGDIGDNTARRDRGVLVHRVPEPDVDVAREELRRGTPAPSSFRLLYPDGPRDAETLLVHPRTGRVHLVTKPLGGRPRVYAAPARLDADRPNTLEHVGDVRVGGTGTAGGPGIGSLAQSLVTGGDISPDGTRVALRTYTDLYEWPLTGDDVAGALAGEPRVTALPVTYQGEAVAYTLDGTALLLTSEGRVAPVHRVPSAFAPRADGTVEPVDGGAGVRTRLAVVVAAAAVGLVALRAAGGRRRGGAR